MKINNNFIKKMAKMVRKRSRRSSSSSGGKMRKRFDVQPQLFIGYAAQLTTGTGTNGMNRVAVPVPLPRTYSSKNPVVMELLKVEMSTWGPLVTAGTSYDITSCLSTSSIDGTGADALNFAVMNPTGLAIHRFRNGNTTRVTEDFSSNDGRGVLVATDRLYFTLQNNGGTLSGEQKVSFRIWYRFMAVGLSEYVGIVNQQQVGGALSVP